MTAPDTDPTTALRAAHPEIADRVNAHADARFAYGDWYGAMRGGDPRVLSERADDAERRLCAAILAAIEEARA